MPDHQIAAADELLKIDSLCAARGQRANFQIQRIGIGVGRAS